MSETEQDEKGTTTEDGFNAFKRKLEEAGVTVTVAADADPANAERARKKYAKRRLIERMTRGRLMDE